MCVQVNAHIAPDIGHIIIHCHRVVTITPFVINKKNNELRYNAGQTYEADRIIKELPETLEAHKSRDIVIMSLEEAKEFFQIDFKKNIFGL